MKAGGEKEGPKMETGPSQPDGLLTEREKKALGQRGEQPKRKSQNEEERESTHLKRNKERMREYIYKVLRQGEKERKSENDETQGKSERESG